MRNTSNISSEEELLALQAEGKITQDEYEELLGTLRRTGEAQSGPASVTPTQPARTSGMAIASLVLSLIGPIGCIPAVICGHIALIQTGRNAVLKGRGLALAGVIIGYVVLGLLIMATIPFLLYCRIRTETLETRAQMATSVRKLTSRETTVLKSYPLDDTDGLITQSGVAIDKQISNDGNGSLRVEATETTTVRLLETGDIDIENAWLVYQAKLRTQNVKGQVYLEMWCHFPGKGEFFSKGLLTPLTGTTAWTTAETPFFLKEGENPDNIRLNLVIDGKGTAWIDEIRLLKGTL